VVITTAALRLGKVSSTHCASSYVGPGPVWTGAENLALTWIWSLDRPAHSVEGIHPIYTHSIFREGILIQLHSINLSREGSFVLRSWQPLITPWRNVENLSLRIHKSSIMELLMAKRPPFFPPCDLYLALFLPLFYFMLFSRGLFYPWFCLIHNTPSPFGLLWLLPNPFFLCIMQLFLPHY
jgi:hypothetical protein